MPMFFPVIEVLHTYCNGLEKCGPVDEKENPATPHVNILIQFLLSFPFCVCVLLCIYWWTLEFTFSLVTFL